jgi:TLC domain
LFFANSLLMMELSNPFMHLIHMLRELNYGDTAVSQYNKMAFALVFFLCRIVFGPVVVYQTIVSPTSHWIVKAGAAGIQLVSVLWFHKIVGMAMRSSKKSSDAAAAAAAAKTA